MPITHIIQGASVAMSILFLSTLKALNPRGEGFTSSSTAGCVLDFTQQLQAGETANAGAWLWRACGHELGDRHPATRDIAAWLDCTDHPLAGTFSR